MFFLQDQLQKVILQEKKKKDGFNQDAWLESQKAATKHQQATLADLSPHNQVMEEAAKWEAKIKEVQYKKQLLQQYQELKNKGWKDDAISAIIPEATRLVKKKKNTISPKKASSRNYQKKLSPSSATKKRSTTMGERRTSPRKKTMRKEDKEYKQESSEEEEDDKSGEDNDKEVAEENEED